MTKTFFFLVASFTALTANALTFEAFSQTAQNDVAVTGSFVQEKTLTNFPKPLTTNGHFTFVSEKGVIWAAVKPVKNELIVTPTRLTQRNSLGETTLSTDKNPTMSTVSQLLLGLLAGDMKTLETHFTVKRENLPQGWRLTLEPASDMTRFAFKSITIEGDRWPERIVIDEKTGDRLRITLADQKALTTITNDLVHALR